MEPKQPGDPRQGYPQPPLPPQSQPHPGYEREMKPPADFGEQTYQGHGRLEDRIALITGGDSGIGRAVTLAFAREGAHVAIAYLDEHEDAKESERLVRSAGREAMLIPGDLADPKHCHQLVQDVAARFGRIDILVNNAAYQGPEVDDVRDLDAERLERTFRVNVIAMFHLAEAALDHMGPGGNIINVSSIQAYQPSPGILDYAATKGAIVTFTKGLAHDLVDLGIRVNAVAPGPVWTPLVAQSFEPEHIAHHGEGSPMGRPAEPAELAPAFVFLASDEARFVTGEVLGVTGGVLLP